MRSGRIVTLMAWLAHAGMACLTASAQPDRSSLPQIVRVEAYEGTPCGVGQITFRLPKQSWNSIQPQTLLRTGAIRIDDPGHRVLYPTFGQPPAARFFRGIVGPPSDPTDQLYSCWFVFRGEGPFELNVLGCQTASVQVTPRTQQSSRHLRMLNQWWREYQRSADLQREQGDYPDLVETYLLSMLSYRLQQPLPKAKTESSDPLQQTFDLLLDAERLRSNLVRERYQGQVDLLPATASLPPPIQWTPVQLRELATDVVIEPIADVVPVDCFYLRFGTWDNQLWLKKLLDEYGGGLSQMVQLRGYQARIESKFLDQLAIESTQLDEWFGGNLIQDVAIIGSDTFFDSGPAIGVLLHAKDTRFLERQFDSRRSRFARRNGDDVQLVQVQLGDDRVSLLASPNHRYRSFHAVAGDFHLLTNSRVMAEKFLAGARGGPTLGRSMEFRYARQLMAVDRDDTVFVYFSTAFFQQLLSPHYQIELRRRSRVIAEMQMMRLAQLAAAGEGYPDAPLEFLSLHGFVPPRFFEQGWVGRYEISAAGWEDSARGLRGFFLPIPDVEITSVTPDEYAWFESRAKYFAEHFSQLDPLMIGVQRFARGPGVERVVFDARLAPFAQDKYGWLTSVLGPPLARSIQSSTDDAILFQASLKGVFGGNQPPYHLFGAVQDDMDPRLDLRPATVFDAWKLVKQVPGYIGAYPAPGFLDWLPRLGGQPDAAGYTYSRLLDVWRYQKDNLSLVAFDRSRLERVKHDITIKDEPRPAQVRIMVKDFNDSRLRNWANAVNFQRAWQTSIANVRLLNTLIDQFGVNPDDALREAEELLDVRLICSLGGKFRCVQRPGGNVWVSDAWPDFMDPTVPEAYTAPLLTWFRGLELEVTKTDQQFSVHGFLDMKRADTGSSLPGFDLFKGFQNLLPGS
ncbi:MAG TPA: hypothetical protein PKD54_09500, partial [Pirellulaceae bacterium]|nr:hypothetical protein [Pirellulaceae bacterium]